MLKGKWWEIYQDPQLNQLEERIATFNQGLHKALETYLAAEDQVKAARSALYPTLSAGPSFEHERLSKHRPLTGASTPDSFNDLQLTGQGSWEPDFWGRVRRIFRRDSRRRMAGVSSNSRAVRVISSAMA